MKKSSAFFILTLVLVSGFSSCFPPSVAQTVPPPVLDYESAYIGTLKYVPVGSFLRDGTAENVSIITKPFRMSECEITRAQYENIMGADPSNSTYSFGKNSPVQLMTWYDAVMFCNKLSAIEGLEEFYTITDLDPASGYPIRGATVTVKDWDGTGYRLPTDMEWMWAAMGAKNDRAFGYDGVGVNKYGHHKDFAGFTGSSKIGDYAVFGYYGSDYGRMIYEKTQDVGNKLGNELGLFDMSGNVYEWCWDWLPPSTLVGTYTDYRGPDTGDVRMLRSSSWGTSLVYCILDTRTYVEPGTRSNEFGFRVVRY